MQPTPLAQETVHANWPFVVRTVAVSSVMVGTLGAALHRFIGVATVPLAIGAAGIGLVLGLKLPPAAPRGRARIDALTR